MNAATGGRPEFLLGLSECLCGCERNVGGGGSDDWSGSGVFFVTSLQSKTYES